MNFTRILHISSSFENITCYLFFLTYWNWSKWFLIFRKTYWCSINLLYQYVSLWLTVLCNLRRNVSTAKILTANCPYGEVSLRRSVLTLKCPHGEKSLRQNVLTAEGPYGKMSYAEMSYGGISGHGFLASLRITDTRTALLAGCHWGMGRGSPPKMGRPAIQDSWNDRACRFQSVIGNTARSNDICVTEGLAGAFACGSHSKSGIG